MMSNLPQSNFVNAIFMTYPSAVDFSDALGFPNHISKRLRFFACQIEVVAPSQYKSRANRVHNLPEIGCHYIPGMVHLRTVPWPKPNTFAKKQLFNLTRVLDAPTWQSEPSTAICVSRS